MNSNMEKYKILTANKPFSYQVRLAMILLNSHEMYDVLKDSAMKSMVREGEPSAIMERIMKELYDTKVWYIPDTMKIWDKRFGSLLLRPFFAYDSDVDSWTIILDKMVHYVPQFSEYPNRRLYNRDWEWFAEVLAIARQNQHPNFQKTYEILMNVGLPEKLLLKKQNELLEFQDNSHYCRIRL